MPVKRVGQQGVRDLCSGPLDTREATKRVSQALALLRVKLSAFDARKQHIVDDAADEDVELFDIGESLLKVVHACMVAPAARESIA